MRRPSKRLDLTAALGLAATLVASCAEVEAEVPEVEVTEKGVSFRGVGGGGGHGEVSATQTFALDSENLSWVKDLNSKVYLTQIELRATGGTKDLGFIHYAQVVMAGDHDTKPVTLVDYVRPEPHGELPVLTARTPAPVDISAVWTAEKVWVTVTVAGRLPERAWTVDVTLRLSGKLSYKL